ncbi:hypothetical protein XNC3_250015 [Xenorhabdus nematophila F1]|nr:hypothetical protein XNC3_250015 [Xenorhabdus nematophila F1]
MLSGIATPLDGSIAQTYIANDDQYTCLYKTHYLIINHLMKFCTNSPLR